jgi:Uma2 family endonuclease
MSVISSPPPIASLDIRTNSFPAAALYRLSVEQYHDMLRKGILKDGAPIELVEGVLVQKMTKRPRHCFANQTLRDLLGSMVGPGYFVSVQDPVTSEDSEPEPDVWVARGTRREYLEQDRHPGPQETPLVVEVADSSLEFDETNKLRANARARLPVYWIVNLIDRRIQVYTNPTGPADEPTYGHRQDFGPADEVAVVLDGREVGRIPVRDLLL